jgi:hypothetical protein
LPEINYHKTLLFVFVCFAVQLLPACRQDTSVPPTMSAALQSFGSYESKFRSVIEYFQQTKDSIKLNACFFIIENIKGLKSVRIDSGNNRYITEEDVSAIGEQWLIRDIDLAVESCREKCDPRKNHWHTNSMDLKETSAPERYLIANFFHFLIRLQVAFIYFHAAVGKMPISDWANGTAVYYWFNNPTFGMCNWMKPI